MVKAKKAKNINKKSCLVDELHRTDKWTDSQTL